MENKKYKSYCTLAAISFGIFAVGGIYFNIRPLLYIYDSLYDSGYLYFKILALISDIGFGAMAVTVFIKNKKALAVSSMATAIIKLIQILQGEILFNIAVFISISLIAAMCILNLKGNKIVKNIWFVPGIIYFVSNIYTSLEDGGFGGFEILIVLICIVWSCGFILTGLWLKEDVSTEDKETVNAIATNAYQANTGMPNIGDADRLMKLKSLLDSGIITKEEFDEKKKQILGL